MVMSNRMIYACLTLLLIGIVTAATVQVPEKNMNITNNLTAGSICLQDGTCLINVSDDYVPYQGATQDVSLNSHNLTDIGQLQAVDGSVIRFGAPAPFTGVDQAINIHNNQTIGSGVITHVLTQDEKVLEAWQSGRNNSAGFHRNSYLIFGDQGLTNATALTNAREMWELINISSFIDYDTANQGAALGVEYAIETQKIFIHDDAGNGQFLMDGGDFRVISADGNDIDLYEAAVHIIDLEDRVVGEPAGANLTAFLATFVNSLSPFVLVTSGKGIDEWSDSGNGDCPIGGSAPCAHAGPSGGSGDTIMQANFSSTNLQLNNLTFFINTDSMTIGGDFEVTMNNNVGSGDVSLYSLVSTDAIDQAINLSIPSSMDNQSLISMEFIFSSSNPILGNVWVDTVAISATVLTSTEINQTFSDGELEFGDGSCRIKVNGTDNSMTLGGVGCTELIFQGNTTFTDVELESQNVTGSITATENITTDQWFNGLYNWTVSSNYLTFDGATLTLDDAGLNNAFNQTQTILDNNASWLSTYNATYDKWAHNETDGTFNLYNSTWSIDTDTNETTRFGNLIDNDCPAGNYSYGFETNGTIKCRDDVSGSGGNESWNESHANTLYAGIEWDHNETLATFTLWNSTWDNQALIEAIDEMDYTNLALTNTTNYFNADQNVSGVFTIHQQNARQLQLLSAGSDISAIDFGISTDLDVGRLTYDHINSLMGFTVDAVSIMNLSSTALTLYGDIVPNLYKGGGFSNTGGIIYYDGTNLVETSDFIWDSNNGKVVIEEAGKLSAELGYDSGTNLGFLKLYDGSAELQASLFGDGSGIFNGTLDAGEYSSNGVPLMKSDGIVNGNIHIGDYDLYSYGDVIIYAAGQETIRLNNETLTANFTSNITAGGTICDGFGNCLDAVSGGASDGNASSICSGDEVLLGNGSCQTSSDFGGAGFDESAYTSGSVIFSNGTDLIEDNSNFHWDNTNKRLIIGNSVGSFDLDVNGDVNALDYYLDASKILADSGNDFLIGDVDNVGVENLRFPFGGSNANLINATGAFFNNDVCINGGNCLSAAGGGGASPWVTGSDQIYNRTAKVGIGAVPNQFYSLTLNQSVAQEDYISGINSFGNENVILGNDGGANAILVLKNYTGSDRIALIADPADDSYFNAGDVVIGATSTDAQLEVSSDTLAQTVLITEGTQNGGLRHLEMRARDGSDPEDPLPANHGPYISWKGWDGSAFSEMGLLGVLSDQILASGDSPGYMVFRTTPDGTAATVERMRIDSEGNIGIGTTSPGNKLDIVTGATTNSEWHLGEAENEGGYFLSTSDSQFLMSGGAEYVSGSWIARSTTAGWYQTTAAYHYWYSNDTATDGASVTPVNTMKLTPDGILTLPKQSSFQAERRTTQSINSGSATKVQYNTEVWDQNSDYDPTTNHRFTAPEDGIYHLDASILWESTSWTAGELTYLRIYINGSADKIGDRITADETVTKFMGASVSVDLKLSSGDYVEIYAYQNTGAAVNLIASQTYNFFNIHKVA